MKILAGFDSCYLAGYWCFSQAYYFYYCGFHLSGISWVFMQKDSSIILVKTMNPVLLAVPAVMDLAVAGIPLCPAQFRLRQNMYKYPPEQYCQLCSA